MNKAETTTTGKASRQDDDIDLGLLLGSLWDYKGLILLTTAVFALAGLIYAALSTPIYRADALVQVEKKSGTIPGAEMAQMLGGKGVSDTSTEIEILRSRFILGKVVDQTDLDIEVEPETLAVVGDWLRRKGVTRPRFWDGEPSVWAGESMTVAEMVTDHDSGTRRYQVRSLDSGNYALLDVDGNEIAQGRVGERLVIDEPWLELTIAQLDAPPGATFNLIKKSRLAAISSLKGRLEVVPQGRETGILRLELKGPDRDELVRSLNATNQVFLTQNIARQAEEAEKSLEFLEVQAPHVREQLTLAENRLNEYRLQHGSIDLSFETQNTLNSLVMIEASLNEMELQESELARSFTQNHPVYRSLLEKKNQLMREKARLEERSGNLPETQQQVLRLSRDVEVTQEIYVQLLNRMQELRLVHAGTVGNVRILDEAVAQGQVAPRRNLILALSALAGLLLATTLVLLRAAFNRGIVSPEQLEDLDLPVYATVPLSEEEKIRVLKRKQGPVHSGKRGGLLAARNPADIAVEAIRSLRTSLHFAMLEASDNRLVITGSSPSVGKSFTTTNLAAVCAQAGQKVVIVDADLRKGHIHELFKQTAPNGLSEVLCGQLPFAHAVRRCNVSGLSWVSRGSAPPNPSELLMQERFTEFLKFLSQHFDLVIVDTPPVLAVTDAAIIGKQCGTTLMVVRYGKNTPREVQIAANRLASGGVHLKGTILNAMEKKAATSYGYYGYYHYAYKPD